MVAYTHIILVRQVTCKLIAAAIALLVDDSRVVAERLQYSHALTSVQANALASTDSPSKELLAVGKQNSPEFDQTNDGPIAAQRSLFRTAAPDELFSGTPLRHEPAESHIQGRHADSDELDGVETEPGQTLRIDDSAAPDFENAPSGVPDRNVPEAEEKLFPGNSETDSCGEEGVYIFKRPGDSEDRLSMQRLMNDRYTVYRSDQTILGWLPGHGENFGWLNWDSDPYLARARHRGLTGNIGIHWLAGPSTVPIPPRLYDFTLGYQLRNRLSDQFSYDLSARIGAYSDFEGSARDGIRFPAHAVGMLHVNSQTDFVFGADYLDRDDIAVLPVIGVSLRDHLAEGLRLDLVFPRPRIDYLLNDKNRVYLAGLMDGGTWDIEFPDGSGHVMTYRDLRLILGFEHSESDGSLTSLEFGFVTGRQLELRDIPGATEFNDAFLVQWVSRR